MKRISRISMTSAAAIICAASAMAENVTLTSHTGGITMTGELTSFDNNEYVLNSSLGVFRFNFEDVDCLGEACPTLGLGSGEFGIAGLEILNNSLVPSLLKEYGNYIGYQVAIETLDQGTRVEFVNARNDVEATISIASNGTANGFASVATQDASLVMAGRPPNSAEASAIAQAGQGSLTDARTEEVIAMEALIIFVADDNPVRSLTTQQIDDIFSGKIINWSQVGAHDAPIIIYRRRDGDAITNVMRNDIFSNQNARFPDGSIIVADDRSLSDMVAANANSIGFGHYSEIGVARGLAVRGSCGLLASPTSFNIKAEEYPFSHRLYAFIPEGDLPDVARGFMEYITMDEAQDAVEAAGFLSGNIETATADDQGYRFANAILASQDETGLRDLLRMTEELIDAERLSTTLRFETASTRLDVRAETDIQRLVDMLGHQDFSAREIMLVGYSDSVGPAANNENLAKRRADQVLARIREVSPDGLLDNLTFTTVGRGEVSPIACNDARDGRFANRRVEVWIRSIGHS